MCRSKSDSAKALAAVVPPGLVSGWDYTEATCEAAAVKLPTAPVPGWADETAATSWTGVISTDLALLYSNWSMREDIVASVVVRLPSICVNSLIVALSSILARSAVDGISGGGCDFLLDLCVPLLGVSGVAFFLGLGGIVGRTTNNKLITE